MKPTLVLLPGMDGTGELFIPLLAALDPAVPIVVVRYPDEPLDYAAHEKLARAALPANKRYLILRESFSGPIAIAIAAAAPHGLLGYVLCCSFVRTPRPIVPLLCPVLAVVPPRRIPPALTNYFLMGHFATAQLRRLLARALRRLSSAVLAARAKALGRVDVGSRRARSLSARHAGPARARSCRGGIRETCAAGACCGPRRPALPAPMRSARGGPGAREIPERARVRSASTRGV